MSENEAITGWIELDSENQERKKERNNHATDGWMPEFLMDQPRSIYNLIISSSRERKEHELLDSHLVLRDEAHPGSSLYYDWIKVVDYLSGDDERLQLLVAAHFPCTYHLGR